MLNQLLMQNYLQSEPVISSVPLSEFVSRQTEVNRSLWYAATDIFPSFRRVYSKSEKADNEKRISEQVDWLVAGIERIHSDADSRTHFAEAAGYRLKVLGMNVLELTHEQIAVLEREGLINIGQEFFRQARAFDPAISMDDIFQGSRNVWTAGYLQVLLGLEVKLTPAIFAYSMLYPVTDNYLDDPNHSSKEKMAFEGRFCAWLNGEVAVPLNAHEEKVCRLVKLIEGQYPRGQYKQVYESLLAIHCAQDQSVRLPKAPVPPYSVDVLGITIAKGGTSVLADGVLSAGELTEAQMQVIFNYGVFAQFMDDQEDVASDLKEGVLTVFSEAARTGKLDATMNRMFSFAGQILPGLNEFATPRSQPLIETSLKGIDLLLIDACLRMEAYFSRGYLQHLEQYFPVRFKYMKEVRRQIKKKNLSLERLASVFLPEVL